MTPIRSTSTRKTIEKLISAIKPALTQFTANIIMSYPSLQRNVVMTLGRIFQTLVLQLLQRADHAETRIARLDHIVDIAVTRSVVGG